LKQQVLPLSRKEMVSIHQANPNKENDDPQANKESFNSTTKKEFLNGTVKLKPLKKQVQLNSAPSFIVELDSSQNLDDSDSSQEI
jgi:hypothetical protein